jgi:MFS family permease
MTLACLAVALVAGVVFVVIEPRTREPLIHLRYFRDRHFLMAALGMMIVGVFLMGLLVYLSLFVQSPDTLALSPILTGAALLPLTAVLFVFSVAGPRILAPYSPHWPVTIGMTALVIGCFLLARTGNDSTYAQVSWKLVVMGIGLGLTMPLLPHVGLRVLPEKHAGQGSGLLNTCLYFGASLGVVLGGLVSAVTIRANIAGVLDALPVASARREALTATLAHGSATEVQQALTALDPATSETLKTALRAVQDDAFDHTMLALAVVGAVGALLAAVLLRGPVPPLHSAERLVEPRS